MNQAQKQAAFQNTQSDFVRIDDVTKTFAGLPAVRNVSIDIAKGELFALLGGSGCGKTTLLRMLAGFETPTSGRIFVDGKDMTDVPPYERPINMMFQSYALFPHMSVEKNVAYGLKHEKMTDAQRKDRVREMLSLVQLSDLGHRKPHQLSGGQRQRVALARSLAKHPKVLLLDEPLGALDKKLREHTQFEIANIQYKTGITFVVVTHDQEEALRLSDRIAVFSKGVIDQIGTGPELYANPATRFVAEFIGDSNFLNGEIISVDGNRVELKLGNGAHFGGVPIHGKARNGAPVSLMLRPERIDLTRTPQSNRPSIAGKVKDITFLGNNTHVLVDGVANDPIAVRVPFGNPELQGLSMGDDVMLHWKPETAHAFCGG